MEIEMEFTKTTGWLDWYANPSKPRFQLPAGSVDAHCHVGLDASGATDGATAETQARTDRDAGALLLREVFEHLQCLL